MHAFAQMRRERPRPGDDALGGVAGISAPGPAGATAARPPSGRRAPPSLALGLDDRTSAA